jgi:hypothetical protein
MYKRFAFEGEIHASLDCVPLTVRRKLDLAGIKLSLVGWQQLTRDERLCLCHLPVAQDEEIEVYREVLLAFCQRRDVAWKALVDPAATARAWNDPRIPSPLRERLPALVSGLDDQTWASLDEESRYALLKLADPKREPAKLVAALVELDLVDGPAPAVDPRVAVCDSAERA